MLSVPNFCSESEIQAALKRRANQSLFPFFFWFALFSEQVTAFQDTRRRCLTLSHSTKLTLKNARTARTHTHTHNHKSRSKKPVHKSLKTLRIFPLISAGTGAGPCSSSHNVTSMTKSTLLLCCFEWKTIRKVVCILLLYSFESLEDPWYLRKVNRLPVDLNKLMQVFSWTEVKASRIYRKEFFSFQI